MIYYVEDDDNIRDLVVYTLNHSGFEAQGLRNADEFYAACKKKGPELVLLDIMLPGNDGLSILRRLKADSKTFALPVIMVTAKDTEYDKVVGLDLGADDYVVKPFGVMELIARVRALQRRTAAYTSPDILTCRELSIDKVKHTAMVAGEKMELTLKEYELLSFLLENRGVVFTRERLLEVIWDYSYEGGTRTVDVHITTLRQKLGSYSNMIETVRGIGYRFGG
ncbi:MAG: response regulator transcription factor [Thermoclostridium sp.]|nr:response regulator transcription factor [Thermoclostridium sp.]